MSEKLTDEQLRATIRTHEMTTQSDEERIQELTTTRSAWRPSCAQFSPPSAQMGSAEREKLEAALREARPLVHREWSKCATEGQLRSMDRAQELLDEIDGLLAQPAESGATEALSEKCDNLRTLPDPHGVCAIKVELRRSLDDFCNSQTPVGMLCISPDDLTKLLNDHDALAECVLHFMQPAPAGAKP